MKNEDRAEESDQFRLARLRLEWYASSQTLVCCFVLKVPCSSQRSSNPGFWHIHLLFEQTQPTSFQSNTKSRKNAIHLHIMCMNLHTISLMCIYVHEFAYYFIDLHRSRHKFAYYFIDFHVCAWICILFHWFAYMCMNLHMFSLICIYVHEFAYYFIDLHIMCMNLHIISFIYL